MMGLLSVETKQPMAAVMAKLKIKENH